MSTLLYYLLQVSVASGILYGYYHLALRNRQFHQYNRFYLLGTVVISILVPFLDIPVYFSEQQTQASPVWQTLTLISSSPASVPEPAVTSIEISRFDPVSLLYYTYGAIALLVLVRIAVSLLRILQLRRSNSSEQIGSVRLINTEAPDTPFSFFRWLFWNKNIALHSEKGQQIFRHELYHIRQQHSFDLLFIELVTVVCWINPFFHLIRKELRAIHEFMADRFAAGESHKWDYAELLVMQALQTRHSLVNPFFHNQIKRRIAMITNSKKTSHRYLRKLLVLPVAAIVLGLFAFTYQKRHNDNLERNSVNEVSGIPLVDTVPQTKEGRLSPIVSEDDKLSKVEIEAAFPGGVETWRKYLDKNLNRDIPSMNQAPAGVYTIYLQFAVDKEGNLSDVKPLTNHGYGMEAEAIRVLRKGPKWRPAIQNGKAVASYRKQPFTFIVPAEKRLPDIVIIGYTDKADSPADTHTQTLLHGVVQAGSVEWRKYFERALNANIAITEGQQPGVYNLLIRIKVDEQGRISQTAVLNYPDSKMAQHCLNVVSHLPKVAIFKGAGSIVYIQPVKLQIIDPATAS